MGNVKTDERTNDEVIEDRRLDELAIALGEFLSSKAVGPLAEYLRIRMEGELVALRYHDPLTPRGQSDILRGQARALLYGGLLLDIDSFVGQRKDGAAARVAAATK